MGCRATAAIQMRRRRHVGRDEMDRGKEACARLATLGDGGILEGGARCRKVQDYNV